MKKRTLKLGVFSPYLQGDYIGEIVNAVRQICSQKGYKMTIVRTGTFGEHLPNVATDGLNGVIIIRNAVHPKLVQRLLHQNIPVVAIAHDYFPLDVPVVTSNNCVGTDQAFNYLVSRGHKKLSFVGDITHYDIRKRYERFSDLLKELDPEREYDPFIRTSDALFSGGLQAGTEFIRRNNGTTGVICGAGHTALGFINRIERENNATRPEIVAFDNLPLMTLMAPTLPYIDLNLNLLAARAIETVEYIIDGANYLNETIFINPSLKSGDGTLPLSTATTFVNQNDYAIAIHANFHEMITKVIDSNLNNLNIFFPLLAEFMQLGCLSIVETGKDRRKYLSVKKVFTPNFSKDIKASITGYRCTIEEFPPEKIMPLTTDSKTAIHFTLTTDGEWWGMLSFYGKTPEKASRLPSSFFSFASCMETLAQHYQLDTQIKEQKKALEKSDNSADDIDSTEVNSTVKVATRLPETPCATLYWDLEEGTFHWNDLALDLLGFTTDLERNIYREMDIFDRIHEEDIQPLRSKITMSLANKKDLITVSRFKNAEGHFQKFSIQGEITEIHKDNATQYKCVLSQIN